MQNAPQFNTTHQRNQYKHSLINHFINNLEKMVLFSPTFYSLYQNHPRWPTDSDALRTASR